MWTGRTIANGNWLLFKKGGNWVKVYIAGKITGDFGYKERFAEAERLLRSQGHITMNPAVLPLGFEHYEYMRICYSMIDVCEGIYFLNNWMDSKGAVMEHEYATRTQKALMFQEII
jgi:hypothetical protein